MKLRIFIFGLLLLPSLVSANIVINEIMYDLEGADTGREWIEIYNNSGDAVDLTNWKLYEAETNHKINLFKENGAFLLPAGGYAAITDDPNKFLNDWPNFNGIIFDSAFSLNNISETIVLRNSELIDVDNVIYSAERGANGDGNSLQRFSGDWVAVVPTPGVKNINTSQMPQPQQLSQNPSSPPETNQYSSIIGGSSSAYIAPEKLPHIKARAGEDKIVVVGANVEFRGLAFGLNDKPLDNARFLWTFGDGFTKEGQNITHFYQYPGEYIVVLNVSSGEYSASDNLLIKAIPNQISISEIKVINGPADGGASWFELENKSKEEIDISEMQIKSGNQFFILPESSRIRPNAYLVIPTSTKGFIFYAGKGSVELFYPGGFKADFFNYDGFPSGKESFNRGENNRSFIGQETPGAKNIQSALPPALPAQLVRNSVLNSAGSTGNNNNKNQISESFENLAASENKKSEEDAGQANVITTGSVPSSKSNFKIYLSAILGLVVFSVGAILFIRRNRSI